MRSHGRSGMRSQIEKKWGCKVFENRRGTGPSGWLPRPFWMSTKWWANSPPESLQAPQHRTGSWLLKIIPLKLIANYISVENTSSKNTESAVKMNVKFLEYILLCRPKKKKSRSQSLFNVWRKCEKSIHFYFYLVRYFGREVKKKE